MSDLQETPAVPETDAGGDERAGLFIAGAILLLLGWGVAVVLNVLLHVGAPADGLALGPIRVYSAWGAFAWATALIGLLTGAVGAAVLYVARDAPAGPWVLPGFDY